MGDRGLGNDEEEGGAWSWKVSLSIHTHIQAGSSMAKHVVLLIRAEDLGFDDRLPPSYRYLILFLSNGNP